MLRTPLAMDNRPAFDSLRLHHNNVLRQDSERNWCDLPCCDLKSLRIVLCTVFLHTATARGMVAKCTISGSRYQVPALGCKLTP